MNTHDYQSSGKEESMRIKVELENTCLNCEKPIPMEFELCSIRCLNELADCAKKQGVKSNYKKNEVWKK